MAHIRSQLHLSGGKSASPSQVLLIDLHDVVSETAIEDAESILEATSGKVQLRYINAAPSPAEQEKMTEPMVVLMRYRRNTTLEQLTNLRRTWRFTSIIIVAEPKDMPQLPQLLAKGASEFLILPMDMAEFHRRVLVRVGQYSCRSRESIRSLGSLTVNLMQRTVSNSTESITLTPIESRIVAALADAPGGVVERQDMKQLCWGDLSITDNALNRKIYEVRRTLRKLSDDINIRTIYGHGFEIQFGQSEAS